MLAGLVWELLNFWARCKWIYTVPFFDRLKLFEMPLLGFLGFPPLALAAFATWSLLLPAPHRAAPPPDEASAARRRYLRTPVLVMLAVAAAIFCVQVSTTCSPTVRSRRPLLGELAVSVDSAASLRRAGFRRRAAGTGVAEAH